MYKTLRNKYFKTICTLLIVLLLILNFSYASAAEQVGNVNEIIKNRKENKFGFNRNQYNFILPSLKDEEIIEVANLIVEGKMIANHKINQYPSFSSLNKIDWGIKFSDSPNTFQLYLQCLNPITYLVRSYEVTNDIKYIEASKKIIKSWIEYKQTNPKNSFLWYDHGTALRAENIIYFMLVSEKNTAILDNQFITQLKSLLIEHAEFLYGDTNYTKNHNHGIFQDRALMYISMFLNNNSTKGWLAKAKKRLQEQKKYGFNEEMIHVENSPGYQVCVEYMFFKIAEFLEQFNDDYGKALMKDVIESYEFLKYVMKPNAGLAEIGDTESSSGKGASNLGFKFNNQELIYVSTFGKSGSMPKENYNIYPKTGYYLYREHWNKENFREATWLSFKSGYESMTHKHADDLSFMLYSKGYDIFVDPGWYNYVSGNKYRDYFVSSKAHNTIVVDDKTYSPTVANSYKSGILDYDFDNENYHHILGYNKMYDGVKIDRHFYNLKDNAILIYDDIKSDDVHDYSQLFHTSEFMEVVSIKNHEVLFKIKDTDYYVRVKQLNQNSQLELHKGDFNKESFGYISRGLNKIDSIYTIDFKQKVSNTEYITLITIEDKNGNNDAIDKYKYDKLNKILYIENNNNNYNIKLKSRKRIDISNVEIEKNNKDTFKFTNDMVYSEELNYAWYIINEEDGKVVHKENYNKNNSFEYTFNGETNYIVKAYVKNKYNEIEWRMVGKIDYIDGEYKNVTATINNLDFKIGNHYYKKIDETKYQFVIPYEYFWKTSVKWYVYKDGGYYNTVYGDNVLECEFPEPGEYTVLYYFRTLNGDLEFRNFESIKVEI